MSSATGLSRPLTVWAVAACCLVAGRAGARTLELEEALALVAAGHPDLLAARARAAAAGAEANSARGRLLPSLRLSDRQSWNASELSQPGFLLPLLSASGLGGDVSSSPAALSLPPTRFGLNTFQAAALQPLSGLGYQLALWRAAGQLADGRRHEARRANQAAAMRVRQLFLQLHEAAAMANTAATSAQELAQQATVAAQKVGVGSLTEADVLRVQAAAAAADQQAVWARARQASMGLALAEACGLGDEAHSLQFGGPGRLLEVAAPAEAGALRRQALAQRADLAASRARAQAAARQAAGRAWALWPEVSLAAAYTHVRLMPAGAAPGTAALQAHTASIGLSAQWRVWEWGAGFYAWQAARSEAAAAAAQVESAGRQVGLQLAQAREQLQAARAGIDASDRQLAAASEAWRVMKVLMEAGSATTTDVLAAEAAHTQARHAHVQARVGAALAQLQLEDAAG